MYNQFISEIMYENKFIFGYHGSLYILKVGKKVYFLVNTKHVFSSRVISLHIYQMAANCLPVSYSQIFS